MAKRLVWDGVGDKKAYLGRCLLLTAGETRSGGTMLVRFSAGAAEPRVIGVPETAISGR